MPINPAVAASLVSGISNLFGGARQARQQRRNINATNRANREMAELAHMRNMEMADYQHSKNIEMWKMQNEYNSPEQQMQRFTNAGLNPNLIYGQGTAGNASSMPQYQQVTYQPPQQDFRGKQDTIATYVGSVKQTGSQLLQMAQQVQNVKLSKTNNLIQGVVSEFQRNMSEQQYSKIVNENVITRYNRELKAIELDFTKKTGLRWNDSALYRLIAITANTFGINTNITGGTPTITEAANELRKAFPEHYKKQMTDWEVVWLGTKTFFKNIFGIDK